MALPALRSICPIVETDVRARGSTLIALLPNLSHTGWYRRLVGPCHEIHFISGTLVFSNPYTDLEPPRKGYLWQCRSYVLCVWRPSAPPAQPTLNWLDLDAAPTERMHLRLCAKCGRVRFLPRWVAKPESAKLRQGAFEDNGTTGNVVIYSLDNPHKAPLTRKSKHFRWPEVLCEERFV